MTLTSSDVGPVRIESLLEAPLKNGNRNNNLNLNRLSAKVIEVEGIKKHGCSER